MRYSAFYFICQNRRKKLNFRPVFPGQESFYLKEILSKSTLLLFNPHGISLPAMGILLWERNNNHFKALPLAPRNYMTHNYIYKRENHYGDDKLLLIVPHCRCEAEFLFFSHANLQFSSISKILCSFHFKLSMDFPKVHFLSNFYFYSNSM